MDFEYRGGTSGVKYLMRGPSIDWGVILLKPGELMAEKAQRARYECQQPDR